MADEKTGLNIPISAYADEDSAKKAVKDISKAIDSSVKGGRITVPVDINVPIDENKEKLTKAQKVVIDTLTKMTSKGFSASGKDIDDLTSKFNDFTQALDQAGKGRQNKIFREIKKRVEEVKSTYRAMQIDKKSTRMHDTKVNKTTKQKAKKVKGYIDTGAKISKKEIDAAIKTEQKRRYKGTKFTGPAGFGSGWIDPGKTNEREAKLSEVSSYPSNIARQLRQSEKESQKWMKESLTITKDKKLANQLADEAVTKRKTRKPTAIEEAGQLTEDIRKNILPEILNKIKTSTDDKELNTLSEKFFDTLEIISKLNREAGQLIFTEAKKTIGLVMGNLGFTSKGNIGGTEGDKKDESKNPKIEPVLKKLLEEVAKKEIEIKKELVALEQLEKSSKSKSKIEKTVDSFANRMIAEQRTNKASQTKDSQSVVKSVKDDKKTTEKQIRLDMIEHSAERVADSAAGKKTENLIKDTEADLNSGFNTDSKADEAIRAIENINKTTTDNEQLKATLSDVMCPCKEILESISTTLQTIFTDGIRLNTKDTTTPTTNTKKKESMLVPVSDVKDYPDMRPTIKFGLSEIGERAKYASALSKEASSKIYENTAKEIAKHALDLKGQARDDKLGSKISTTVKNPASWIVKLRDVFADLTQTTANYKVIMSKTSEEQDKLADARIRRYGLTRSGKPTDSGDKISVARRLSLFRDKDYFKTLFNDITLSKGVAVDTTKITDRLAKVLSGPQMFKAQTGGWVRNILGAMTGGLAFAFQPSLEKDRARIEGLNQIMANIRKEANTILQDILDKESKLRGMKASGALKQDVNGNILEGSSQEAKTLVLQLEESKDALKSILADAGAVGEVVRDTHGRVGGIIKRLGFTSEPLRKNNAILANINAGLDKNGKALKYQTRLTELLGYGFRLIGRHIGQMFKNLMLTLNPINLIKKALQGIKGLFQDFISYDTKWQRTMNVIKYNLRAILKPAMEWIAQQFVNVIGFLDIISMKVQEAFGQMPISLFDQVAADAEKTREELEAASNITAGFDELHDIGTDNSGAMDLMGEIYKPQLSQEWIDLANEIGDLFAGLIKGDLGFGEVMGKVLELAWKGLQELGKMIWDWFKNTTIGKWITENWQHLLWTLLNIFIAWKLLKIIGPMLLSAFTGWATEGMFGGLFSKIAGWLASAFQGPALAGTMAQGGASLGQIFAVAFVGVLAMILGEALANSGRQGLISNTNYNAGVKAAGGKASDLKDNTGKAVETIGGRALEGAGAGVMIGSIIPGVGTVVGGVIGGIIGAIGGTIESILTPAFEDAEIAARNMNNEMQKTQYYEGIVTTAQSKVDELTQMIDTLNSSLDLQTQKVYKEGEDLGITKTRMDELIESVKNGSYHTDMLTGDEKELAGSLEQLSGQQEKVKRTTERLTDAKKKLEKAQLELAIAQDVEAGNFELAAARVEYAYAAELYTVDEATDKMTQIMKQGSIEQQKAILKDMSPEIRQNWSNYYVNTEQGVVGLCNLYWSLSEYERKTFSKDYAYEASLAIKRTLKAVQQTINDNNPLVSTSIMVGYKDMIIKAAKRQGIDISGWASFDVGTNYVPSDGLAYLHQGEAVIPAKYNNPYKEENLLSNDTLEALVAQVSQINAKVDRGITVSGEFIQRGPDLLATVQKTENKLNNALLSNKLYAR